MKFLAWLSDRMPDVDSPAPAPPTITKRPLVLEPEPTSQDDPEMECFDDSGEIILEPFYGVIDYRDSKGQESRRRITLIKLATGPQGPILKAVCHERKAMRSFRCDRIDCFITEDGEVIGTQQYFREHLFVDVGPLTSQITGTGRAGAIECSDASLSIPRAIRNDLNSALFVLVAAAKSDGEFHPEEIDAICIFIEDELNSEPLLSRYRDAVNIELLDDLNNMVRRIRPQRRTLSEHLATIAALDRSRLARFRAALEKVVMADGKFVASEMSFVRDFDEICGTYRTTA